MASSNGVISHALLLEVDTNGRPSRLELTTPAGLLTLHPEEGSGALHGNVVAADGVRHLSLAWSAEHGLAIEGRPVASAVTAHRLSSVLAVGEGRDVPVVAIAADLTLRETTHRYRRVGEREWRIEPTAGDGGTSDPGGRRAGRPGRARRDPGVAARAGLNGGRTRRRVRIRTRDRASWMSCGQGTSRSPNFLESR